jgi:hypothetical protein
LYYRNNVALDATEVCVAGMADVPSHSATVELPLTMEDLNLQLTCTVTVMAGDLGMYSAYVEPSGLPWSLGYEQYCRRFARRVPSTTAPLSCTDH